MPHDRRRITTLSFAALLCAAVFGGCQQAPEEPAGRRRLPPTVSVEPLTWKVPPTWNVDRTAKTGTYRAKYTVPLAGNAKHTAELLVTKLDSGPKGDVTKAINEFLNQFEGAGLQKIERTKSTVGSFKVETVELGATYKFPMGPPMGPNKKRAAHMIKEGWRGLAAGVEAGTRGKWFFRLVGPNDTVEAARSGFHEMIKSLK